MQSWFHSELFFFRFAFGLMVINNRTLDFYFQNITDEFKYSLCIFCFINKHVQNKLTGTNNTLNASSIQLYITR